MNKYLKNTAFVLVFAGLISVASAQSVDFEYMEQQASVERGGSTGVEFGVFSSNSDGGQSTLELVVDQNGDGDYSSEEVVAQRNVDIMNYTELKLALKNVSLDSGTYDYTSRLQNGSGYYYYPYGEGSLKVEKNDEFEPEIEMMELEKETEGPYSVGERFDVVVSTETEEVVSFETYINFDRSKMDLLGVEPVSSSFYAERRSTSARGEDIVTGQGDNPVDSPKLARVTFEAEHSGYSQINTQNSELGTELDTFTGVGEDEVSVSINESGSSEKKVESIEAEVSTLTVVEVDYNERTSDKFKINVTDRQSIIKQVAERTDIGPETVSQVIEIKREEAEVKIRAEIGEYTVVTMRSSTDEKLNQKFNLSFKNKEEIVSEVASRTQLERKTVRENIEFETEESEVEIKAELGSLTKVEVRSSTSERLNQEFKLNFTDREKIVSKVAERTDLEISKVRANIEFEEAPLEEMKKESLIEKIKELREGKTEELREKLRQVEKEKRELERENERLRERLGETNSSNRKTEEREPRESSGQQRGSSGEDSRESGSENQKTGDESSQENTGFLQQIMSIFN